MIPVSVTNDDCISLAEVKPQLHRIVKEGASWAGIEQDLLLVRLDQERNAPLTQHAMMARHTLDQHRNVGAWKYSQALFWEVISICTAIGSFERFNFELNP
jgi:hypothetical protein